MYSKFCDNDACRGKLGMVVQRWLGYRFCSKECKAGFLAKLAAHRERINKWFSYLET